MLSIYLLLQFKYSNQKSKTPKFETVSVNTDLDLERECVPDGSDVVIVGEKDAVVADDHAVRVDVLFGPTCRSERKELS